MTDVSDRPVSLSRILPSAENDVRVCVSISSHRNGLVWNREPDGRRLDIALIDDCCLADEATDEIIAVLNATFRR